MTLSSKLVPTSGCLFGAWVGTACISGTLDGRFRTFETQINRTSSTNGLLNLVHTYPTFATYTSAFPTAAEASLAAEGRILLVDWTPKSGSGSILKWADIASGLYDSQYIDPTAARMRDFGKPFFLKFHHEMERFTSNNTNNTTDPKWGTSAEYVSAAQHVHDRFAAAGATNVVWVWCVVGYTTTLQWCNALYPGDAYVDWLAFDPYSTSPTGTWENFDKVFGPSGTYPFIYWANGTAATHKTSGSLSMPVMICEWGVADNPSSNYPNNKPGFYDQFRSALKGTPYSQIRGAVYFDSVVTQQNCVNENTASLQAYQNLAADSFYNPDVSPQPPPPAGTIALAGAASAPINKAKTAQVIVPATVQAGYGMGLFVGVTRSAFRNGCEGTNAAAITTGNSNSAGSNPWDAITATAPTYDTSQKHSGASSMHASLVATPATTAALWSTSFGSPTTYYGSCYVRKSANPSTPVRFFQQASAAGTAQWGIGFDTAGALIVRDLTAGATRLTMSSTITNNVWHRVEWQAIWDGANTTVTLRLYLDAIASETTKDEELTATTFAQAAAPGRYNFGVLFSAAGPTYDLYLDDMGIDPDDWLGPAGTPAIITVPAGWSAPLPADTNVAGPVELRTRLWRKTAASGDPGSTITVTTDVTVNGSVLLVCWSGPDPAALEDVVAVSQRQSSATTVTSPSVVSTVAGDWIVTAYFDRAQAGSAATSSWTPPTGDTLRASSYGTGTDGRVSGGVSDDGVGHVAGTYGSKVATANATSYLASAWTLAVRPAAAGTATQYVGVLVHQL